MKFPINRRISKTLLEIAAALVIFLFLFDQLGTSMTIRIVLFVAVLYFMVWMPIEYVLGDPAASTKCPGEPDVGSRPGASVADRSYDEAL